ncbi:hypothetical protein HPB49_012907 [Dermacentor silvarum]|uniref:Uncharacterized protein n=1 Tax=Dermacentor silvarum TaxID=543639 RepID=A0ACB8C3R1_DERSI|nr:hypothetical protein HPB49_012907 [Dermacentor silvarum]
MITTYTISSQENNQSVADEIKLDVGVSAHAYQCDVSDEKQVRELARRVSQEVGPVAILVNNAAVTQCQPLLTLKPEQIRRTLDVNLLSHFWMIQEFLPGMLVQKEGHIVAMSSIAGYVGTGYLTDYCASKFAVRGLMCALNEELYQLGLLDKIKLTTVCPMAINTGMFKEPKSRFPWLAPILETQAVADRTMDAILREELEVVIPHRILLMHRLMFSGREMNFPDASPMAFVLGLLGRAASKRVLLAGKNKTIEFYGLP